MTRFVSKSRSGQKYKNIHTKWTDFKRIQVYLPFPCHQRTQYYPQTANFNTESPTCQFYCAQDKSTLHRTGNPCEGNPCWGTPIRQIIFCNVYKYKLEGHIVLDYFLFKYMISNHHSLQLIKISFENNYIDQYERIIEDAPVLFTHNFCASGMWMWLVVKTNVLFSDSMLKFTVS